MVAFIGAVICIIAAVHTGSSKVVPHQQPSADNQSLYAQSVAQTTASRGSVARAGPLVGALHGSETPQSETPTFKAGLGVTGLTGHDPRVSRLICTPIPAGECDPRNFNQQAADEPLSLSATAEGNLRTAAEELRQTVQQQEDQIITDQRTIRELSGKLTDCEREQGGRIISERRGSVAGLLGAKGGATAAAVGEKGQHDRIMVRDSPASAPDSVHLLTVRAVDELEQAITQLKDRIEKLESDIGPFPQNQTTDTNSSRATVVDDSPGTLSVTGHGGADGVGGGGRWAVEDLEGQLERKVELLEKERKALRMETEKHRHDIDQGLHQLHLRLAGLEHGSSSSSPPSFPEGFRVSFPSRTNYMYARVRAILPQLRAITACMWLRSTEERGPAGTPLSYAVPGQPNELVLLQGPRSALELLINDKVAQLPLNLTRGSWQHMCVSWSQKGGAWQAYQGGRLKGEGHGLAPGHHLRAGGQLVLGQEQDSLGGGFDSTQALVGELAQVGLWDRVLTPVQVAGLARCGRVAQGSLTSWTEREVEVHGGATKHPGEPCSKHSRSSQ
ncbi:unnamed protein product [Arctogadus glacialis]